MEFWNMSEDNKQSIMKKYNWRLSWYLKFNKLWGKLKRGDDQNCPLITNKKRCPSRLQDTFFQCPEGFLNFCFQRDGIFLCFASHKIRAKIKVYRDSFMQSIFTFWMKKKSILEGSFSKCLQCLVLITP